MKIVIIGPAHPIRGGISDTNEALCRAFMRQGHTAEIVSFSMQYPSILFPGKSQYSEDAPPESIKISSKINSINPLSWMKTARYINQTNPDLVIVRYWIPFMGMCLGFITRRIKNSIKIALCDNVIPHERRAFDDSLTRFFVKPFHGFITMSKAVSAELNDYSSIPKLYFPHPINDKLGARVDRATAASKVGLDSETRYVVFFGLIRKYKGVDLLVRAMSDPRIKEKNIKLLIIGEFYEPVEEYLSLIKQLGLADAVIIKNEFIPADDIKYYFSLADLVAQTYRSASQSGVTQVAYNFNVPVLTTNVGGLAEIIDDWLTGYVVDPDVSQISGSIVKHFKQDRRAEFVQNIQNKKRAFSWDSFVRAVEDFYAELASH